LKSKYFLTPKVIEPSKATNGLIFILP
jgi:hypothetical protein